ncbi:MAG: fatty acid desaturase [Planktotalea sp.]|uniref:fatty acid desaturase n=1 Tax=Planktotalea sp. TaxID=2029877 RepID=UPI003C743389
MSDTRRFEWPTWAVLIACYGLFGVATLWLCAFGIGFGIFGAVLAIALHSSLSHEVLHGHPFKNRHLNAALVFPALSFAIPYMRFRDTHLAHHEDSILTDPYDDPETNFLDPKVWHALGRPMKALLRFNNTLAGRMLVGPALGQVAFMKADWALVRAGDRRVLMSWLWHVPAAALPVIWIVQVSNMPLWAYFASVYIGLSVLKIRTFLEHRAHEKSRARTVVIEDRGVLAFLFLNNNFHSVHHMHPQVAWYDLPALYQSGKARFLAVNEGYQYRSYAQIFRAYFFKAKDPVPHPLWSKDG